MKLRNLKNKVIYLASAVFLWNAVLPKSKPVLDHNKAPKTIRITSKVNNRIGLFAILGSIILLLVRKFLNLSRGKKLIIVSATLALLALFFVPSIFGFAFKALCYVVSGAFEIVQDMISWASTPFKKIFS